MALGEKRRQEAKKELLKERQKEIDKNRVVTAAKKASAIKKSKATERKTISGNYCRYCQQILSLDNFIRSTNPFVDKNGYNSVCKTCMEEILENHKAVYQDIYKAMFITCQDLDFLYDEGTVSETIEYMEKYNSKFTFMSKYKQTLSVKFKGLPIRFRNSKINNEFDNQKSSSKLEQSDEKLKELRIEWGDQYSDEEYHFLDKQYKEYESHYNVSTPAEKASFKTLVMLYLRQRKDPQNKDVISAIKEQLRLCGISPEQEKRERSAKGSKTLGLEIALYEQTEPIQYIPTWEAEHDRYLDYDGLQSDLKDINRNIKNFFTDSRDFNSEVSVDEIYNASSNSEDLDE